MSIVSACPGVQEVARYLLHRLPSDETAQLTDHLKSCAKCFSAVQSLRGRTGFPARQPASQVTPSVCDSPTRIGGAEAPVIKNPTEEEKLTPLTRPASSPGLPPKEFAYLGPPQGEDEIGRLGTYRILKALGAGGMGVVFAAADLQLKRAVALKVMKPAYGTCDESRQRFLREARAAAAIEHDHVVTIYQVGEDRGLPYIAMQLLQGESLADRLRREKQLPIPEVLRIGREIAEGLAAAHARGVIHRDVKPDNIWLEGERGRVKLLDFGLARAADDVNLTRTGTIMGTPEYMSPEQARGKGVDARSDVFSLGCVMYAMCAGQTPFHADETMAVLSALAADQPRAITELNPKVPELLVVLIMRLLAKHPEDRVATARIAADTMSGIADAYKPVAKPERTRGRKKAVPVGRQILLAAALAAITFMLYWYSTDAYHFIAHSLYRMNIDWRVK
jgi:serine/threonine protein kinase